MGSIELGPAVVARRRNGPPHDAGIEACERLRVRAVEHTAASLIAASGMVGSSWRGLYSGLMCRNIKPLHNFEPSATDDEVHAAALQYVRKVAGTSKPSTANQDAFDQAVTEVAATTRRLLDDLVTKAPRRDREVEAARAKERSRQRFATTA